MTIQVYGGMIISEPLDDRCDFDAADAELVEAVIVKMLRGKTAGLWSYSGQHSHPLLSYEF